MTYTYKTKGTIAVPFIYTLKLYQSAPEYSLCRHSIFLPTLSILYMTEFMVSGL